MDVIIIHGCPAGDENEMNESTRTYDKHWIGWIKEELSSRGIPVSVPLMPHPWEPEYDSYNTEFKRYPVTKDTVLIGHSGGCAFLVRWLGETKQKIKKLILVAPWKIPDAGNQIQEKFYGFVIDKTIRDRVGEIVMFTADNEAEDGRKSLTLYKKEFGGRVISLPGHGHYIHRDMGTDEFSELLDLIVP